MRGRRNKDKPLSNPALPPCRVCGEPGSGFHYGVTTCGACKGFFRRSMARKDRYVCIQSHLCHVGPSTSRRQSCPKCRYDKCVALGMSKDACKVGRYSLVKKSTYMMEVMEHKTKVFGGNTGSDDGMDITTQYGNYNTATADEVKTSPLQYPVLVGSQKIEKFSDVSSDFEVDNQEVLGGCSPNEEIRWNFEGHNRTSQHGREVFFSSSPDSGDSSSFDNAMRVENHYDESLSMSYCFLGADCGDKVSSEETGPIRQEELETKYNSKTEPLFTLLEAPVNTSAVPPLVELDTPKATCYSPCFNRSNFTDFSPNPINTDYVAQHSISVPATTIPYNQNPTVETSSLDIDNVASPHYLQINNTALHSNYTNHNEQLVMTTQQRSFPLRQQQLPLPVNYHTLQQDYTTIQTKSGKQSSHHLANQSINSENWMETSNIANQDRYFGMINGMHDVSIKNHDESTLDLSNTIKFEIMTESSINANHTLGDDNYPPPEPCYTDVHTSSTDGDTNDGILTNTLINSAKRQNDGEDENEIPHKMAGCTQTSEIISPMPLLPTTPASLFLLFLSPEMSNGKTSLFDRFKFTSYERQSLEPILRQCFEINEYLPFGIERNSKNQAALGMSSGLVSVHPNVNETTLVSVFTSAPSPEVQEYTCSLNYDSSEMDVVLDHLMAVNNRYFGNESSYMSESDIKGAQETFWALCQLQDKIHGRLNFIEDDKYFTILDSTGIDVDKRKAWLMAHLISYEGYLKRVINFFRSVSGFGNFTLADKITLTKSNLLPYNILTGHRGMDESKSIVIDGERGMAVRLGVICQLVPQVREIQSDMVAFGSAMKSLSLTHEEIVLLKALIITTPNPSDVLEEPEMVDECHKMYQKCLLNLLRKLHGPSGDDRFAKIFNMLQRLNEMREEMVVFRKEISHLARLIEDSSLGLVKESCFGIRRPTSIVG